MSTLLRLLVVSAATVSLGPSTSLGAGQAASTQTVAVIGRVTAMDDAPLARARVTAEEPASTRVIESVMTDDRGRFTFAAVIPPVRLTVSKASYATEHITLSTADVSAAQALHVRLARGAVIVGRVTDQFGHSAMDAIVRLRGKGGEISVAINDLGEYRIGGLAAGTYSIGPVPFTTFTTHADPATAKRTYGASPPVTLSVAAGDTVAAPEFFVEVPGRDSAVRSSGSAIVGTVVDDHGEPIQGAMVDVLQIARVAGRESAHRSHLPARQTDDRGHYRVAGVMPGTYVVRVWVPETPSTDHRFGYPRHPPVYLPGTPRVEHAARITVAAGRDVSSADVIVGPPSARLSGTAVTSAGQPIRGEITLTLSERSGAMRVDPIRADANADGSFAFSNVPPGDYVVQAFHRPGLDVAGLLRTPEFTMEYVTVTSADPAPLRLKTSRGVTLAGRVRFNGADPSEAPYFSLQAVPADSDRAPRPSIVTLKPTGTFRLDELTGPRRLVLSQAPAGWYLESATIKGVDAVDKPFDFGLREGFIADAEIVIATRGAGIRGEVTDDKANPLYDYSVIVFPTQRDRWYPQSRFLKLGRPAQDGTFHVESLPPGDYWFAAVDRVDTTPAGEWLNVELLESLAARATRIALAEGEVHRATLRLIRR